MRSDSIIQISPRHHLWMNPFYLWWNEEKRWKKKPQIVYIMNNWFDYTLCCLSASNNIIFYSILWISDSVKILLFCKRFFAFKIEEDLFGFWIIFGLLKRGTRIFLFSLNFLSLSSLNSHLLSLFFPSIVTLRISSCDTK